jgi:hypothetical protein
MELIFFIKHLFHCVGPKERNRSKKMHLLLEIALGTLMFSPPTQDSRVPCWRQVASPLGSNLHETG